VFQAADPIAMLKAVRGVVHERLTPDQAYALYLDQQSGS
jgi:3-hydroxy-5-phosphonooxypentane-2,4-dione thiolase